MDNILRIRFTTSHPVEFSDRLIQAYADIPKLANHLHLPAQSGSDRILTLMKRGHTALEYKSKIRALREVRPGISVTSDFIVGFPGETESDFEATLNLISDLNLDQSYSFIYSQRPGTPAASLTDNVTAEVKKQRLNILQTRLAAQGQALSEKMIGTIQNVLVTGLSKKDPNQLCGRTDDFRVVNFEGHATIGKFAKIRITEVVTNTLRGKCVVNE
jgi:tRNA-2-methylthio-N6-dimethylallyladenosine synthase